MKFGLFDHIERVDGKALSTVFDERLRFAQLADEAGFYCLHVAEHHATPLNMVPVPGVYLGAVARATQRMRLGPLCYLLPLYSPLRLIEEVCMLDHLSDGRFEIGVGRGVSPFELNYHKVDATTSRDVFIDAYQCLVAGLTNETLNYEGKYFTYHDVPIALRPLQSPHPAFWYGSSNTIGATWAGEHGMHFVANGATDFALPNIDAFRSALTRLGGPAQPKAEFKGGTAIGLLRHIVVADTDAEARRIMKPAFEHHARSLNWIRNHNADKAADFDARHAGAHRELNFEACEANGMAVAGSPDTVVEKLAGMVDKLGLNYLLAYLFFGDMSLSTAQRSLALFASEVMPKLKDL